ncbi:MAG: pyridoxal phosphate-dependent aminotransferase [Halanaeroarchaeum sp.]
MFPDLSYLEWMSGRPGAVPYDLGTSGLRGDRDDDPALVPEPLVDLPDAPAGATLENVLAQEYEVHPGQVLVTAGATHANFVAVATALGMRASTDVLVEQPTYQPLVETPRGLGATVDRFDRADDGSLDLATVEEGVTDDTALVVATNRHNPSGSLASRSTLEDLANVAASADAPLLLDEVYAPYVLEDYGGAFGGPTAAGHPNAVVTGSLTKFAGLGDLRIGWLVGPREFVSAARSVAFHLPDVAGPSRVLARRALFGDDLIADQRDLLAANHEVLAEFVAGRDDLGGDVAEDCSFAFLEPLEATAEDVVGAAWEEGVLVVPGRFFGDDRRIRVSAGRTPEDVAVSLDRFGAVLTDVGRAP